MRSAAIALAVLVAGAVLSADDSFDTRSAPFAIAFHNETSTYRDAALSVMPGEIVLFSALAGHPGSYSASGDGSLVQQRARHWKWTAPARPGTYEIRFQGPARRDAITLHVFVMVPATQVKHGLLNGYRIGDYPAPPHPASRLYRRPRGFVEVTKDNEDTRLSPHFTLKQFICKEDTTKDYPKYLLFDERLPLKLEAVLERVNALGFRVDTLHVMSAYRTPYYNKAIGDVKYSMHQWGSAADIYVDPQRKDRMADLNGDGEVDIADAKFLYDDIERLLASKGGARLQGGLGFYPATAGHPPFVHLDVRGTAARWKG